MVGNEQTEAEILAQRPPTIKALFGDKFQVGFSKVQRKAAVCGVTLC